MIWCLHIPGWHPTPLNELMGSHAKAGRLKAKDREIVSRAVLGYGVAKATAKRRVSLMVVYPPGQRMHDPDAFYKSALDALVATGALHNDSRKWVEWDRPELARGEVLRTFITIQDVTP